MDNLMQSLMSRKANELSGLSLPREQRSIMPGVNLQQQYQQMSQPPLADPRLVAALITLSPIMQSLGLGKKTPTPTKPIRPNSDRGYTPSPDANQIQSNWRKGLNDAAQGWRGGAGKPTTQTDPLQEALLLDELRKMQAARMGHNPADVLRILKGEGGFINMGAGQAKPDLANLAADQWRAMVEAEQVGTPISREIIAPKWEEILAKLANLN